MNIQNANAVDNPARNDLIQANMEQPRQEEQNAVQNQVNREVNRDEFTRSPAAERMQELNENRLELQEELGILQKDQNQTEAGRGRTNEIRREINLIEDEMRNMARQPDATDRMQREAINRYNEQNQAAVRAQNNNNRNTMNLFGE